MKHPSSAAAATLLLLLALLGVATVATTDAGGGQDGKKRAAGVYIVIVQPPADGADTVAYHTCILAAALGSEERAKEALLYSYRTVASGFAAKLTPPELPAVQKERAKAQGDPLGNSEVNVRLVPVVAHSFADDALHSFECLTLVTAPRKSILQFFRCALIRRIMSWTTSTESSSPQRMRMIQSVVQY